MHCIGKDVETGEDCTCEEYQEQENPPSDKPIRCRECLHGKSLHKSDKPTLPQSSDDKVASKILQDLKRSMKYKASHSDAKQETNAQMRKVSEKAEDSFGKGRSKVSYSLDTR